MATLHTPSQAKVTASPKPYTITVAKYFDISLDETIT